VLKILYISPAGSGKAREWEELYTKAIEPIKRSDVEAKVVSVTRGPPHLEYYYYEYLVMEEVLQIIRKAEKDGFHAAVIGCFYDPGLQVAREVVKMPVIAPAEACMHVASTLGHKFSIITGRRKFAPRMEDNIHMYGLESRLASIRTVNFTVPQMAQQPDKLKEAIFREAQRAIEEDEAEVIVLGCTAETGFYVDLMNRLNVPVVDAVVVTWKYAEMMADLYQRTGLTHCKLYKYEPPPAEEGSFSPSM
jgi:allantoin racemase